MKLPSYALVLPVLLLCLGGLSERANSQTKTESKVAEATVSGKVTIKGKPAAGIVVGMRLARPDQFSATYKARTDQEGLYRITKVSSGSYFVAPVTPSFVIADPNNTQGQSVIITESENVEGINFDLVPGGVITGRVVDSEGQPLIEQPVTIMPGDERDQRLPNSMSSTTDDRGVYRIFGLPAGRYKVCVGDPRFNSGRRRQISAQTFYPDVTDVAKAGIVEVREGSETSKIDIKTGEVPQGYSVTGRVVEGESGNPVTGVYVQLNRIEVKDGRGGFGESLDVQADARGQFRVSNVRPGKYDLIVYPPDGSDIRMDGSVRFDVMDQDVSGLVIKTTKGATIAGIVVFEGGKNSPASPQIWVSVYSRNDSGGGSGKSAQVKPDGTFLVGGLPAGIVNFNVEGMNNRGFYLTRVERDGVAQTNGVQVQNSEHVRGVRLVMTYNNGSIRGSVRLENGTLPPTGRVMVQISKAGEQSPFPRVAEVDARGRFLIESLPSGNYELWAVAYAPEWKRRPLTSVKQIVIVTEGAASEVTVTLDLTPSPNQ